MGAYYFSEGNLPVYIGRRHYVSLRRTIEWLVPTWVATGGCMLYSGVCMSLVGRQIEARQEAPAVWATVVCVAARANEGAYLHVGPSYFWVPRLSMSWEQCRREAYDTQNRETSFVRDAACAIIIDLVSLINCLCLVSIRFF